MPDVNIIGAGLAGLSAAVTLAGRGQKCRLVSPQPSERAQSVLAEGGINAALNTMGEQDTVEEHFEDTMAGGAWLADPEAVRRLTEHAPEVVTWLSGLGVPFHQADGRLILRNFGGQKKKRTAYVKSSTGKVIVSALIDEVRKYEAEGLVKRYPHHSFVKLLLKEKEGSLPKEGNGVRIKDRHTGQIFDLSGPVLLASGGMNGMFPERTTGTTANSGDVTAIVHAQGAALANLEMIQYHPTTIGIAGKRCLISEAARGEGGRLFVLREGKPWYFMEEKYPELGNLMPRDVISREMFLVVRREDCGDQVYLDLTGLTDKIWLEKLSDLREEIESYLNLDPAKEPVPVSPGIHYFMGGIKVNLSHQTSIKNLYAAGECACQYHGANRLGGNSMLGAIYGGRVAAEKILSERAGFTEMTQDKEEKVFHEKEAEENYAAESSESFNKELGRILYEGMGIVRNEKDLLYALSNLGQLEEKACNARERARLLLAEEMLKAALLRKESLGAHYREDG